MAIGLSLSSPADPAPRLDLSEFVSRLVASPAFRQEVADEHGPGADVEAHATLAVESTYDRGMWTWRQWTGADACDVLCLHYEQADRAFVAQAVAA